MSASRSTLAKATSFTVLAATGATLFAGAANAAPSGAELSSEYKPAGAGIPEALMDKSTKSWSHNPYSHGWINAKTGQIVYCAFQNKPSPSSDKNLDHDFEGKSYDNPQRISPETRLGDGYHNNGPGDNGDGYIEGIYSTQAAYIVNKYGQPAGAGSLTSAQAHTAGIQISAVDLAISMLASKDHKTPDNNHALNPAYPEVKTLADQYIAEAAKYASTSYKANIVAPTGMKEGSLAIMEGIGVKNAEGEFVPGIPMTLTITGAGTFSNGTKTQTFTSQAQAIRYQVNGGDNTTSVAAASTAVPDGALWVANVKDDYSQDVVVAGQRQTGVNASVKLAYVPNVTPLNPKITTQTSQAQATEGVDLYDTVNGSGFPAGAKVTGKSDLYEVKADGTQGAKIGTATYTATADAQGNFSVKTSTVKVDKAGKYNWVESHDAGQQGDKSWPAATSKFGEVTETTVVTPKTTSVTPTVTTQTSHATAAPGVELYDTVIGKGFPAGAKVTGKSDLYEVKADGTQGAKIGTATYTATADAKGEFTVKTSTIKVDKVGKYNWVESHDAGSVGNTNWPAGTAKFGEVSETSTIAYKNVVPKVTTQTSQAEAGEGVELFDTVNGSGFPAGAKVTGKSDLYEVKADGTQGAKIGTATYTATADAQGNFSVKTTTVKVDKAGTYNWVESHAAGQHGDSQWPAGTAKFGEKTETTVVKPNITSVKPVVTTKASHEKAASGTDLYDTVIGKGFPAGAKVTGTSDLYAYNADGTQGAKVGTATYTATADAKGEFTVKTSTVKVDKAGKYGWVESHAAGKQGNVQWSAGTSKFGEVSETTLVVDFAMKTKAAASALVGDELSDVLNVTGVVEPGTVTASLYHMDGKQDTTKDNTAAWEAALKSGKAVKVGSVTVKINKDGTYTTPSIKANKAGVYTWAEDFTPDGGKTFNVTKPGEANEITNVTDKPKPPVKETPKPEKPVTGPKVQTDGGSGVNSNIAGAAIALGVLGAAGAFVARRRMSN